MMKWEPALALPNVDFIDPVESSFAVIAGCDDRRVKELQESHPILKTFLSRFTNEFDVSVRPSVFLVRKPHPQKCPISEGDENAFVVLCCSSLSAWPNRVLESLVEEASTISESNKALCSGDE